MLGRPLHVKEEVRHSQENHLPQEEVRIIASIPARRGRGKGSGRSLDVLDGDNSVDRGRLSHYMLACYIIYAYNVLKTCLIDDFKD